MFNKCGNDAQCTLIARDLKSHLGTDFARHWRERGGDL
jgi:hypothetical protein